MSPVTVPAYSLESFPAMAWGGRWWGDSNIVYQSHIQETNQSSRKPNGQAWGRGLKKRDPTPSKSCGQGTTSLPPRAELHAHEHQYPGAKQPQSWHRAGDHSLCSYQPEVRDLLPHRASCPHKSLGVELNWPLIWISPNKAQNQGLKSSNQLQITLTVEKIQHYTAILKTPTHNKIHRCLIP